MSWPVDRTDLLSLSSSERWKSSFNVCYSTVRHQPQPNNIDTGEWSERWVSIESTRVVTLSPPAFDRSQFEANLHLSVQWIFYHATIDSFSRHCHRTDGRWTRRRNSSHDSCRFLTLVVSMTRCSFHGRPTFDNDWNLDSIFIRLNSWHASWAEMTKVGCIFRQKNIL